MTDLVDIAAFKKAEREAAGSAKIGGLFRASVGIPKAADESRRAFRFCFSDSGIDRMSDTIDADGWDLTNFLASPTALFAHDSSAPPIGRAANVQVEGARLMGDIEFASPEIYEFADTIYKLVKGGFLNTVSVGFLPTEYQWTKDEDREWGMDFLKQELLEISVVPVPANPRALIDARAKGIDTRPLVEWAERALDGGGKIVIPKTELAALRKAAKEPTRSRRRSDGMSETDPSSGGTVVATCARGVDDECGMSNPQECAVHMAQDTEDKRIARLVARGVRAEIKRLGFSKGTRRRAEGDDDDEKPEYAEAVSKAMDHLDAADACFKEADDHYDDGDDKHDEGMSFHAKAVEALDTVRESMDDDNAESGEADPDSEKAAARRLRRAKRLAERHQAT